MIFLYIFLFIILLIVIAQSRITILEHLAKQGSSDAQVDLAAYYVYTAKDYEKGLHWTKKAIEQGNPKGDIMLGIMYENGYGVEKDIDKALESYKKAAYHKPDYKEKEDAKDSFVTLTLLKKHREIESGKMKNKQEIAYWTKMCQDKYLAHQAEEQGDEQGKIMQKEIIKNVIAKLEKQ